MDVEGGNIYSWMLKDPRWLKLRGWVIKRAHGRCERCKQPCNHLQIHHWFYGTGYNGKLKKPWDYRPRQLVACCRKCHVKLHMKQDHKMKGGSDHACYTHCGGSLVSTLKRWLPGAVKSRFQSHFSVRYDLQPFSRATLAQYGDMTIEAIQVCREPVAKMISTALNALSFGRFNKSMAANGYDKMFHLFMSIKMIGGPTIRMERNEVIGIKVSDTKGAEQMMVPLNGAPVKLNTLWQQALAAVGNHIYEYDPIQNNCQRFVNDVLQASSLLTPALQTFIMQRADNLLPMYAQKFGRWTTDLAAKFNHVLWGHGRYKGGVWPTAPPPSEPWLNVHSPGTITQYQYYPGQSSTQYPPQSEEKDAADYEQDLEDMVPTLPPPEAVDPDYPEVYRGFYNPEPGPPSTSAPPPEQKGTGISWHARNIKQGLFHPFQTMYRIGRKRDVFTGRGFGGKYAHSSSSQSRAQQDKKVAEDQESLTEAIKENMEAVKGFIDAFKAGDEKAGMQIVMELTSKATGNPATAGLIPLLAGTADLISGHTNPMDPDYHKKTRQYLDQAFSIIPVVGPILENWIAPMQQEKFNAPADSYTGQMVADPKNAKKFDGNLWMQDWSHADPTGYWKIKTADEMRAYNQKYHTNYTVYGSGLVKPVREWKTKPPKDITCMPPCPDHGHQFSPTACKFCANVTQHAGCSSMGDLTCVSMHCCTCGKSCSSQGCNDKNCSSQLLFTGPGLITAKYQCSKPTIKYSERHPILSLTWNVSDVYTKYTKHKTACRDCGTASYLDKLDRNWICPKCNHEH